MNRYNFKNRFILLLRGEFLTIDLTRQELKAITVESRAILNILWTPGVELI